MGLPVTIEVMQLPESTYEMIGEVLIMINEESVVETALYSDKSKFMDKLAGRKSK